MTVATRKTFDFCTARDLPAARVVATDARAALADGAALVAAAAAPAAARIFEANAAVVVAPWELEAPEGSLELPVADPIFAAPARQDHRSPVLRHRNAVFAVRRDHFVSSVPPFQGFGQRGVGHGA